MRGGAALLLCAALAGCATAGAQEPQAAADLVHGASASSPAAPDEPQGVKAGLRELGRGIASWYGAAFQGKRTASGEPFDMHDFTAAHPWLPFGTLVEVRSLVNGRTVTVRINDRGPFSGRRAIDLSRAAAQKLGLLGRGTKPVEIRIAEVAAGVDASTR